jgi:hypothetical protein
VGGEVRPSEQSETLLANCKDRVTYLQRRISQAPARLGSHLFLTSSLLSPIQRRASIYCLLRHWQKCLEEIGLHAHTNISSVVDKDDTMSTSRGVM